MEEMGTLLIVHVQKTSEYIILVHYHQLLDPQMICVPASIRVPSLE